jgi:hypothetical protein
MKMRADCPQLGRFSWIFRFWLKSVWQSNCIVSDYRTLAEFHKNRELPKRAGEWPAMSEPSNINNPDQPITTNPPEELFDRAQLRYFDSEDTHAGAAIGKMLSLFFLYTVLAMSLVAYWTFRVVAE